MKTTQQIVDEDYEREWLKDQIYLREEMKDMEDEELYYSHFVQTIKGETITEHDKESEVQSNPS